MTRAEFIQELNKHKENDAFIEVVIFVSKVTRFSTILSVKLMKSLWNCSKDNAFGENVFEIIKASAEDSDFQPKLDKACNYYFYYLDTHTAFFALHKIKEYNNE